MLVRATPRYRYTGSNYKLFEEEISETHLEGTPDGIRIRFGITDVALHGSFTVSINIGQAEIDRIVNTGMTGALKKRIADLETRIKALEAN